MGVDNLFYAKRDELDRLGPRFVYLRREAHATDPTKIGHDEPLYADLPEGLRRILRVEKDDHHWVLVEVPERLGFNSCGTNSKVANSTALGYAILDAVSDEASDSPVRGLGEALTGRTGAGSPQRDVWVDHDLRDGEPSWTTWWLLDLRATSDTQSKVHVPDRLGFPAGGIDNGVAAGDRLPKALTIAVQDEPLDSPVRALAEALAGVRRT